MPRSLHLVTSSLRLRLGIISFTVYPAKNELNICFETLCQVHIWAITDARVPPGLGCSCSICPGNRREHSKTGVVHLLLEAFPDSLSQAEASTSLRCLCHALYYAAMAANPWIEVFSPCLTSLRMDASYLSLQCLFLVVGETQYVFSEQEN